MERWGLLVRVLQSRLEGRSRGCSGAIAANDDHPAALVLCGSAQDGGEPAGSGDLLFGVRCQIALFKLLHIHRAAETIRLPESADDLRLGHPIEVAGGSRFPPVRHIQSESTRKLIGMRELAFRGSAVRLGDRRDGA